LSFPLRLGRPAVWFGTPVFTYFDLYADGQSPNLACSSLEGRCAHELNF